jgi:SNF2 family DNA or RNA helicase
VPVELTEKLLSNAAGWDATKRARGYLQLDHVLSSEWAPPLLRGVVQAGELSFRAGLVINGPIDIENLCTCRESREWGKICAHSVAVGLHWLKNSACGSPSPPGEGGTLAARGATGAEDSFAQSAGTVSSGKRVPRLRRDASGEPAELFIILPPNFVDAAARGKVMLVLEASWRGGRGPVNSLPATQSFAFDPRDSAILDWLEEKAGETPAMLLLDVKHFVALLPLLAGLLRVTLGKHSPVNVSLAPFPLPLRATLEANGEIVLASSLSGPSRSSSPTGASRMPPLLSSADSDWVWENQTLQPLGIPPALRGILQAPLRIPRTQVPLFLSQFWPALAATGHVESNFKAEDFILEPQAPKFLLELKGGLAQLTALLQCTYGPRVMTLGVTRDDEALWLPGPDSPTHYSTRDFNAERTALNRLGRSGFTGPDSQGRLQLNGQNAVLNFFACEFPRMQREWSVTLEDRLQRSTHQNLERIEPRFQITPSGVQWFDLGVVFESSSGEKFSAADIQRLVLGGQSHTRLKNGRTAVIDTGAVEELQEVLLDCAPQQHAQAYRIDNTQAGFLESTLKHHPDWKVQAPSAWRERAAKQSGEAKLECPPLGALEEVLRPYQKHGVAWLQFLRENGFSGILADEMGLGKTLQALALLESRTGFQSVPATSEGPQPAMASLQTPRDLDVQDRQVACPTLVVCPTSLVFNWVAEARKFTSRLRVLALHGPERHELFSRIPQCDLVVTSYALVRRDAERYAGLEFDTVILDEAQHIKNRQTRNAQAVKAIRSQHRLVLTGTPLENSVLDLWSIFDFLMPGYLGSAQDFRERYEIPITREKNPDAQARLARRLRPFILRRLKREVAKDLPAKLEQVSYCELTEDQRAVYQQLLEATRKEVLDAVGAQGVARSRMVVLTALLRLRQVCCDLRLLKLEAVSASRQTSSPSGGEIARSAGEGAAATSGKLELFSELLEEVLDGGHRALVFSQFTSMLGLLKEKLAAEQIEFCYLDGSTNNRAEVVERFQKTPTIPVFLISLKAGGVGLNLTGADTVIHFDPWWNPAVEDQATDRAHRIGQTRVVTSYKLITRDTIEEKILTLQQRKREVIAATIGDEAAFAESLSWEEIQELLA